MRAQLEKRMAQRKREKHKEKSQRKESTHESLEEKEDREACERDETRHDKGKKRQQDQNLSRAAPEKRSKNTE